MMIADQKSRAKALNVNESFCIEASAGSGKTAILLKRYLKLWPLVNNVSEILYLTHTNKAVREMRDRVVAALKQAQTGLKPNTAFEAELYVLAVEALKADKKRGWNVMENPSQLNIMTNDAYNQRLLRSALITSSLGGNVQVAQEPMRLYERAAQNTLSELDSSIDTRQTAVATLLNQVRNNFTRAQEMLVKMLATREQWLPIIAEASQLEAREVLEESLADAVWSLAEPVYRDIECFGYQIEPLLEFMKKYCDDNTKDVIEAYQAGITSADGMGVDALVFLADFFTTDSDDPSYRKQPNSKIGFPALKDAGDKEEKEAIKFHRDLYKELVAYMPSDLLVGFKLLKALPPVRYSDEEWNIMEALINVLPLAVGHLKLVFKDMGEVDFTEISSRALNLLGDEDAPDEALLKVDNSVSHLLVDEFQDTNLTQLTLIKRITCGWEKGDGRTLVLVGDAMQSIYQFRGAVVGLFASVMKLGINGLGMEKLTLTCNFRSQANVVTKTNEIFTRAMPSQMNLNTSAIPFTKVDAVKPAAGDAMEAVYFDGFSSDAKKDEAEYICSKIAELQATEPKASIAVLGRARADLVDIIARLKSENLNHIAVDIQKLKENEVVMDVIALTKSIMEENNSLAWAEFLRTPLVGLSLQDISSLAPSTRHETFLTQLQAPEKTSLLSTASREKIERLVTVVKQCHSAKYRKNTLEIVYGAFVELSGFSAVRNENDIKAVETYFEMLERFGVHWPTYQELDACLESLYSEDVPSNNPVKLMTGHNAKGLEFDYVFIPQAHKGSRGDDAELLANDILIDESGLITPVLAPMVKSQKGKTTAYDFIRRFASIKRNNEAVRLAYVMATRHKRKLFITGETANNVKGKTNPVFARSSLFGIITPVMDGKVLGEKVDVAHEHHTQLLRRQFSSYASRLLPQSKVLAQYRGVENINNDILPEIDTANTWKRLVGEVIHAIVEGYSNSGCIPTPDALGSQRELWRMMLVEGGVAPTELFPALRHVEVCIKNIISDVDGQAILKARANATAEMSLHVMENGELCTYIVDKVYQSNNIQHIVDYKSGLPGEHETQEQFVQRMLDTHEAKMRKYSSALREINGLSQEVGLYLMAIGKYATYNNIESAAA